MIFYPIAKIALILFLSAYLVIAVVVIKQINLMTRTIQSGSTKYLYILSIIHLLVVGSMLIFAFVAL